LNLLPPRIANRQAFAVLIDTLAVAADADGNAKLRLRLVDRAFSWQALVDLAQAQDILFPLIWALKRRSLLLPAPLAAGGAPAAAHPSAQLTSVYQQHRVRRQRQRVQLLEIITALNRANIEPVLLKGARYLLAPADSWQEARDMRDLDLLVRPEDAGRTVEALLSRGYAAAGKQDLLDHHLPEMWRAGEPSAVEIHTEALSRTARKILPTADVWRLATRSSADGNAYLLLPSEWHLLHGLLHHQISDRGHFRKVLAVKPLWEFAMLAGEISPQGWQDISHRMAAAGKAGVLGSWIAQARELYGLAPASGVVVSPAARAHAAATIANAAAPDWQRHARFTIDRLRFGFSIETLAWRYHIDPNDVSLATMFRHVRFMAQRTRDRMLDR
jgi:hypothetical protein